MRSIYAIATFLTCVILAHSGDDASGSVPYSVDLSQPFTTYSMTTKDKLWSKSLLSGLKYRGAVVYFARTSLAVRVRDRTVQGEVYQAMEKPEFFYVVSSDAMLKLNTRWAYTPGVGGFSMHAPKSRNFIVCVHLDGGVPFLSSSLVQRGIVTWNGHDDWDRLK
jgi:hypothetical protein